MKYPRAYFWIVMLGLTGAGIYYATIAAIFPGKDWFAIIMGGFFLSAGIVWGWFGDRVALA